jgi:hypothetical protein
MTLPSILRQRLRLPVIALFIEYLPELVIA